MDVSRSILLYIRSIEESLMMLRSPATLVPFVVFAALQCTILFALTFFSVSPLSSFMVPIVARLGGADALHYPAHLALLPSMYHRALVPLLVLVGFPLFATAVFRMGDAYARDCSPAEPGPALLPRLPAIVGIGAITVAAVMIPGCVASAIAHSTKSPLVAKAVVLAGVTAAALPQSLLIFSLIFTRTTGAGITGAIAQSARFARRHFLPTILLVLTMAAVHVPLDVLLLHPDKVVLRFPPEFVFYALLAGVLLQAATQYLVFATTTSLVLSRRDEIL